MADLWDAQLLSSMDSYLRSLGFQYITVDLRGLRSGSLNEVLQV